MKKINTLSIFLIIVLLTPVISFSQDFTPAKEKKDFYIGIGSDLSTFIGGEFGSRYGVRYSNAYDYYDRNNYYYNDFGYVDNRQANTLNPLQFNLIGGVNLNNNFAVELQTGILFHTNGYLAGTELTTGTQGNNTYVDHLDNASIVSVPIIASMKFYPLGKNVTPLYLTGGYGVQFVYESVEKVRDYDLYNNYYFQYGSYRQLLNEYSTTSWMNAFKIGAGGAYSLFGYLSGDIEIAYTYFLNGNTTGGSELALQNTPEFGNLSLGTSIFLEF